MNLAWFTPFFAGSAIGAVGINVVRELEALGHRVVVIGCGDPPYATGPSNLQTVAPQARIEPDSLAAFDAIVYNLGNHPSSLPLYALCERVPGIVVLHDRVYVDLLVAYAKTYLRQADRFEALANRFYGEKGADFARRFMTGVADPAEVVNFPLWEPLLELASNAVVHTEASRAMVSARWKRPVLALGLPVVGPPRSMPQTRAELGLSDDDVAIVYCGMIAPSRQIHVLLEALRDRSDLRERSRAIVVGRVEEQEYANFLQSAARFYGIGERCRFAFNATDELKHAVLSRADVAFNCRAMGTEGASASLLEQMAYGLPIVANRTGFAAELPHDAAYLLEARASNDEVATALGKLVASPELRASIGAAGKRYFSKTSSPAAYAQAIADAALRGGRQRQADLVAGAVRGVFERMSVVDGGAIESTIVATSDVLLGGERPWR